MGATVGGHGAICRASEKIIFNDKLILLKYAEPGIAKILARIFSHLVFVVVCKGENQWI
jgi:hypothetical protein